MQSTKITLHLQLEREGALLQEAQLRITRPMNPESAVVIGAYLDAVVAGIEPSSLDIPRMREQLSFYVAELVQEGESVALGMLESACVWAVQDALTSAKAPSKMPHYHHA